jgi:hypothetical protein
LRLFDARGDIEQVLPRAVDLEHVAAVVGLARFAEKLRLTAACVWRIANSGTGRSRSAGLRIGGRALNSGAA